MNIDSIKTSSVGALKSLSKYLSFIFIVLCIGLFCYHVITINKLNNPTVSDEQLLERSQSLSVPNVDKETVDKIQQLESQNIQLQSLFDDARSNPFSE